MKSTSRGFIPVLIAVLIGLVVLGGSAYFAMRQSASTPVSQDQIALDTTSNTQPAQNTTPAASQTQPQTQTNNSVKTTAQTSVKTSPPPAPTNTNTTTAAPATTCTYTSNTGVMKTATAAQASTPESCQSVCVSIRNETFGMSDSGVCEFKRSTGGDYIYNIQPGSASASITLAASVYITPKGITTLRPPKGWTPNISIDIPPGTFTSVPNAAVAFVNPNDNNELLGITIGSHETSTLDSDMANAQSTITSKGGQVVSATKTTISGFSAFVIEARFPSTGLYNKETEIFSPSIKYVVVARAKEGNWTAYSSVFDQAVASLQIN